MTPPPADDQARKDELIQRAYLAFERDAPALCREHTGEWVAYHGDRRVGCAKTRAEAWQECLRLGLPEGEFWVFDIQPVIGVEAAGLGMTAEHFDP
jgi:hypothetical protein